MSLLNRFRSFRTSSVRRERQSTEKRRILLQQALIERFKILPGVSGAKGCVSFECFSEPRFFLCHCKSKLLIDRYKDSVDYKNDATFVLLPSMWFKGYFAFECFSNPGWFVIKNKDGLCLKRFDGREDFKQCASFKLARKKCLTCTGPITQGVRVWVRVNNMCFDRGVVTKDGSELHIITAKGKVMKCAKGRPESLSLDKIPDPQDLRPGTRVAAQWHDRMEPYYIGTVQGSIGKRYVIQYDDDDEDLCELKSIRVLLWTESTQDEVAGNVSWSSLHDIPRLSSGMLIDTGKNTLKTQLLKRFRKISRSDSHLDIKKWDDDSRDPLYKSVGFRDTNRNDFPFWDCCVEANMATSGVNLASQSRRNRTQRQTEVRIFDDFNSCP